MPFLNSIFSLVHSKRLAQIKHFSLNPGDVQNELLLSLVKKAKNTEWGVKYGYSSIKTIDEFKSRVPISSYEAIETYITRNVKGEQNLLWPEDIRWFAKSSGTTSSKSKFIPISNDALVDCHFKGGKDVLALYNDLYPENGILTGKSLTLGGSHQISNLNGDAFCGDLSAILIENMPFWTHLIKTPNQSIALMDEWESKLQKMTEYTVNADVRALAGVPSWLLVLLSNILSFTGKENILEVWPNLELFIHGGINFSPYREQYNKLIPSKNMHYMETYNASEGFFGIQTDPNSSAMLLMLDYGIFFEFVPVCLLNECEHPKTLSIEEIDLGVNYAIIISTNGGLWRYLIGDTIKFHSKFPYKFTITGRTKQFMNAFGEEVIVDNADKALKVACEATESVIRDYSAAPKFMSAGNASGAHEWIIEFSIIPNNIELFTQTLDDTLKSLNSDYEAKRHKSIALKMPIVKIARRNLFIDWMKRRNKLGGQNKVPRLANNREYIDQLLQLNDGLGEVIF